MELGEKLQVIINAQYEYFATSMVARGLDPSLSLLVLEGIKARVLESAYQSILDVNAKAELVPCKKDSHTGTVEDLKEAMNDAATGEKD